MAQWVTQQWQETNAGLHHAGLLHKPQGALRATLPIANLLVIKTKRNASRVSQILFPSFCEYLFLHCFQEEQDRFLFSQHWSAFELLALWILEGKWSTRRGEMALRWEALIVFPRGRFTSRYPLMYETTIQLKGHQVCVRVCVCACMHALV